MKTEQIIYNDQVLAIVVRNGSENQELEWPTPPDFPLQLGIHDRKKGVFLKPHNHIPLDILKNIPVQEFIYLEKGKLKFSLYHENKEVETIILNANEMILLNCGHSVVFLEDSKIVEIKQGPYRGNDAEKIYF